MGILALNGAGPGAIVAAGAGSTFNSGRLGTPGLVLSNGNLTVTSTSNDVSVDGTTSKSSGLSQVAFHLIASSGNFPMVGVGNGTHPINAAQPGYLGVTVDSIGLVVQGGSAGTRFFNGSIGADGTYTPTPSVGDWIALALDMTGGTPSIRWRCTGMAGWTNAVTLTGMTGPLFYSVSPDTGTIFTVDPTSANIPLDTGYSAWG